MRASASASGGPFCRALTAALIKSRPKPGAPRLPPGDAIMLARWARAALGGLPAGDAVKAASRLAEVCAACCAATPRATAPVAACIRAVPAAFAAFAAAASTRPELVPAVAAAGAALPPDADRAASLRALLDAALAGRDAAAAGVAVAALAPFVASLDGGALRGGLLAAGLLAVRRSAEAGLTATAALVAASSEEADLSPSAAAVVEAALPAIKGGATPAAAAAALRLLEATAERCHEEQGAAAAADALLIALGCGAAGSSRPRAAAERAGLLAAAAAFAGVAARHPALATRIADALADYGEAEASDDARRAALTAAGRWAREADAAPPRLLARLEASLASKDSGQRSDALREAAGLLLDAPGARKGAGGLAPALARAAADGAAKPAARGDGVAAALAGVLVAGAGGDGAALWPTLAAAECALLAPAGLARLAADDAALAASLAGALLEAGEEAKGVDPGQAARALTGLALHSSAAVRAAARASSARAVAAAPAAAPALLAALLGWLAGGAPPTDDGAPPSVVADRVQAAALACVPRGGGPSLAASGATSLLLIAHHPVLTRPRRNACAPWRALARAGAKAPAAAALEADAEPAVAALAAAAAGPDLDARASAVAALGAAADAAPGAVWPPLVAALAAATDAAAHAALTPDEVSIFLTPPGELAIQRTVQVPGAGGGKPRAAPAKAAPAPRAAAGRAAPSRGAAGGGRGSAAPKKDAAAIWLEEALAGEAEVRASVAAVADALAAGLAAVGGAAAGAPASAVDHLTELTLMVAPLLSSPVVGAAARSAAAGLAAALPPAAGVDARDLATALSEAARGRDPAASPAARRAVAALGDAARRGVAVPPAAASLASPALAAVLRRASDATLSADALDALQAHAAVAAGAGAGECARVLYAALAAAPAIAARVQPLLDGLASRASGSGLSGLVSGLGSRAVGARRAALAAALLALAPGCLADLPPADATLIYAARRDPDADNAAAGESLWGAVVGDGVPLPPGLVDPLVALLDGAGGPDGTHSASAALADYLAARPDEREAALAAILALGDSSPRAAASALRAAARAWSLAQATTIVTHLLAGPLATDDEGDRAAWTGAGAAVVAAAGAVGAASLLPVIEAGVAAAASTCDGDEHAADALRAGAAVLLGAAAGNLPPGDARVREVVAALLDVLRTPSAAVQRTVADCLPGLMPALGGKEAQKELVADLLSRATTAPSYGDRAGAPLGVAGAVRGAGLAAIAGFGVLDAVKAAIASPDAVAREGGLLVFEALADRLGRLFEPYVVGLMPPLLDRFGDAAAPVREAAAGAARAVTANLSSQGVKLVLPALLDASGSRTWRTQAAAASMLGAMGHCAPRQLATALPVVVPRLAAALADPHPKVAAAARDALEQVGAVVRNPEVRALAPALLRALADPGKAAAPALDALLKTRFVNTVDAASLALVVPVLVRGLRERSGDAKQRAARVAGAMASLVSTPADMEPYVPLLLPEVRAALADPLPATRGAAAKTLGALLRGVGEATLGDLLPWLMDALHADGSSVERAGAAQGLAEVLAVLGGPHVAALLPALVDGCASRSPSAREGSLAVFRFLPTAMPAAVAGHLDAVLPAVLGGLADDADGVRAAALSAARAVVEAYADEQLDKLLPAVEEGATSPSWRIRQSSVELLGDLLFRVAGAGGRARHDGGSDDEGVAVDAHGHALVAALGRERRDEVLALVHLARSDVAAGVRGAALHVWKTLVSNTPRTLADATPALVDACVAALASGDPDGAAGAGRCLGELARKMGDRALRAVIPLLCAGLAPDRPADTRRGSALALGELIDAVPRAALADHAPGLAADLRTALGDADPGARDAAGAAFGALFRGGGGGPGGGGPSLDAVLPAMLADVTGPEPDASAALEGLRVLLGVRPGALAAMLPRLLAPPVGPAAAGALAALADAAGPAAHAHLKTIVPALLGAAAGEDEDAAAAAAAALDAVARAASDDGAHPLLSALEAGLENPATRAVAAAALGRALAAGDALADAAPPLLPPLVALLADRDPAVLDAAGGAIAAMCAVLGGDAAPSHARALRCAVAAAVARAGGGELPGLATPAALAPLLPIYLQGVLHGSADLREVAAAGLGELLAAAPRTSLAPHVVKVAGPLIRVVGDRFPDDVRVAVLAALGVLLDRGGAGLRPFVPQLQTTFVRGLADHAPAARAAASSNLGALAALSSRRDALVVDLAAGAAACPASGGAPLAGAPAAGAGGAEPALAALTGALSCGAPIAAAGVDAAAAAAAGLLADPGAGEGVVAAAAAAFGAAAALSDGASLMAALATGPLSGAWPPLATAATVAALARRAPAALAAAGAVPKAAAAVKAAARAGGPGVRPAAARAAGYLAAADARGAARGALAAGAAAVLASLATPDQDGDTQRAALAGLRHAATAGTRGAPAGAGPDALRPHLADITASLAALLSSTSGPIKLTAERTLARVLAAGEGPERADAFLAGGAAGPLARTYLTDTYVTRLGRLPLDDADYGSFGEP